MYLKDDNVLSMIRVGREKVFVKKNKHGSSLTETQTVFADEKSLFLDDSDHSHNEDRFILLGLNSNLWILVVSHANCKDDQDNNDYLCPQGNPFGTRTILEKVAGIREE